MAALTTPMPAKIDRLLPSLAIACQPACRAPATSIRASRNVHAVVRFSSRSANVTRGGAGERAGVDIRAVV